MHSNVPTPSKGALRALRNLALGTSCTIAFGIGVVTEDRRRRIHSARRVHNNAKNLKSSRRYHSSGASPAPTFEEEVARYGHLTPLIEKDSPRAARQRWNHEPEKGDSGAVIKNRQRFSKVSSSLNAENISNEDGIARVEQAQPKPPPRIEEQQNPKNGKRHYHCGEKLGHIAGTSKSWTIAATEMQTALLAQETLSKSDACGNVENDIKEILGDGQSLAALEAAIAKFKLHYPANAKIPNVHKDLLDTLKLLVDACKRHNRFTKACELLENILNSTKLNERQFNSFRPAVIINGLIKQARRHTRSRNKTDKNINAAIRLFLTPLSDVPAVHCSEMYAAGYKLCRMAFEAKLYSKTERIYWRLATFRGNQSPVCTDILILSACSKGRFDDATRYYNNFFCHDMPDAGTFSKVTCTVIYGQLQLKKLDKAEKVLLTAGDIAKRNGFGFESGWILQLLGERWRMNHNISLYMALFDRIEHLAVFCKQPESMYSGIIQHCVEAGREDKARIYLQKLVELVGTIIPGIRIRGHFALAEAMKHNWTTVENEFKMMQAKGMKDPQQYASAFTPILKLFAITHNIGETENFVKLYLEQYGVVPNTHISNIVVGSYAKAKEIDAIPRWLAYTRSLGVKITAVTFNVLFHSCVNIWHIPFDGLHKIYRTVKELDENLVDKCTLDILRLSAIEYDKAHQGQTNTKLGYLESCGLPNRVDDSHSVFQQMLIAMSHDNPLEALSIFTKAKSDKILLAANVVGLAVQAAVQCNEVSGFNTAARIVKQAQDDGQNMGLVLAPLLSHQLNSNLVLEDQDIYSLLSQLIESLNRRGVNLSWRIVTYVVSTLMDQNRTREALDLWTAMSGYKENHDGYDNDQPGIVDLSVLLKGFLSLKDAKGVEWVIQRMLANDIAPDCRFKGQLKNARKYARKDVEAVTENHAAQKWLDTLEESYTLVIGERQRITLEAKQAQQKTVDIIESAMFEQSEQDSVKLKQMREVAAARRATLPTRFVFTHKGLGRYEGQQQQGEVCQPSIAAAAN